MSRHNGKRTMVEWTDDEWDLVATRVSELKDTNPDSDHWALTNAAQGQVLPLNRHKMFGNSQDHAQLGALYKRLGLDERGNVPPPPPPPPPPPQPEPVVATPTTVEQILGRPSDIKLVQDAELSKETVSTWLKEHGTAGFLLEEFSSGITKLLAEIKDGRAEIANCRKELVAHITDVNLEAGKLRQECIDMIERQSCLTTKAVADMAVVQEMTLASLEDWEGIIITMSAEQKRLMFSLGKHLEDVPNKLELSKALVTASEFHLLATSPIGDYITAKSTMVYEKKHYPHHVEAPIVVAVSGPREIDFKHIKEKVANIGVTVHLLPADESIRIPKDVTAVFVSTKFAHKKLTEIRSKFNQHIVPVQGGVSGMVGAIAGFVKDVITARRSAPGYLTDSAVDLKTR